MAVPLTEEDLHELYLWVDDIPISRPKRNIARDFSDGCCVAEVVKFFFPKLVDLHNYTPAMSLKQKVDNWNTLNNRVFRKLHFEVPPEEINDITAAVPGAIERFLRALRTKIAQIKARREDIHNESEPRYEEPPPHHVPTHSHPKQPSRQTALTTVSANTPKIVEMQSGRHNGHSPAAYRSPSAAKDATQTVTTMANTNTFGASAATATSPGSFRLLLDEKDRTIFELRETVALLSEKVTKLEELVRVKDEKLNAYRSAVGRI